MKRRTFLKSAIATAAATPFFLDGMPVSAATPLKYLANMPQANLNDRILIICQLFGGNDGLNTIIPVDQDTYYNIRLNIAIPKNKTVNYAGISFAPNLSYGDKGGLVGLLQQGSLAVVQGIGYPYPNLSHFRSTDIWLSGINNSDPNYLLDTGWVGRYLEKQYPTFPATLPDDPLAIQFGGFSLALQSSKGRMGIEVADPSSQAGVGSSADTLDDESALTSYLNEYNFVADIAARSNKYAQRVKDAYAAGKPKLSGNYASGDSFAAQMANCAALIAGGLNTKVYVVSLGGFDNHVSQNLGFDTGTHPSLLGQFSDAVAQFMYDMVKLNMGDRVIGLTVSEFGRRPYENGSRGTDHGTSSVQFVFGTQVLSGASGYIPSLDATSEDSDGDLVFNIDYHSVYLEVLTKWFDMSIEDARSLLPDPNLITGISTLDPLPVIQTQKNYANYKPAALKLSINGNYPNPFANRTIVSLDVPQGGLVTLDISSIDGSYSRRIFERNFSAGTQSVAVDLDLASGNYLLIAKNGSLTASKMVQCIK
jgi:uncharacterized protein (DUF1501 family)